MKWGLNFFITESGFETWFWLGPLGPGTLGAGSKTHLESRCCAVLITIMCD